MKTIITSAALAWIVDYCDPLIARRMGASGFPEG